MEALWGLWSDDDSGYLTEKQFKMGLESLNLSPNSINKIYDEVDIDGNGSISLMEFASWYFPDQVRAP